MTMLPAYGAGPEFRARFRSPSIRAIPPAGCTAHAEDSGRRQRRPQMNGLMAFSNELAAAVEHAGRATVGVNGRRRFGSTGVHWRSGLIVTADHTVEVDEDVTVTTPDGRTLAATVAGRDPGIDGGPRARRARPSWTDSPRVPGCRHAIRAPVRDTAPAAGHRSARRGHRRRCATG